MDINFYKEQLEAKEDMLSRTTKYLVDIQNSLDSKNKELREVYQGIMDSIVVAEGIQKSLLPNVDILKAHFKDASFKVLQQSGIGGDGVFIKNNNEGVLFGLLDATGHGIPAAMLNISCILLLKELMTTIELNNPKSLLTLLDVQLRNVFRKDKNTFAQAEGVLLGYCNKSKTLSYCSAKGKALLLRKSGEIEELSHSKKSIGDHIGDDLQNFHVDLNEAYKLLIYSDGLTDQFGGAFQKKFSKNRLKELLKNNLGKSVAELAILLEETIMNWKNNTEQTDDISFMIVEF